MTARRTILVLTAFLIFSADALAIRGQSPQTLERLTPQTGSIRSGEQQEWTFTGSSGEVISLEVRATTDELDPALQLSGSRGSKIIANDDVAYPDDRNAVLEAITLPSAGTYTVTVSGYGATAGPYEITLFPGYSQLDQTADFVSTREWEITAGPLQLDGDTTGLRLRLAGSQERGLAIWTAYETPIIYLAEMEVNVGSTTGEWSIGFLPRYLDANRYYLLIIREDGQWRFVARDSSEERVLRDWTPHPAIQAGLKNFRLGALVNGTSFEFFFNGQFFGNVNDQTLPQEGRPGFTTITAAPIDSKVEATFTRLVITVPRMVNGTSIAPERIIAGTPTAIPQELQRRLVIPPGGKQILSVGESFVESRRPGVERILLGRGTTFRDMVMGATVSWDTASTAPAGCGLIFQGDGDRTYTLAYADQNGGYGLSRRDGERFVPGVFGEDGLRSSSGRRLMIIVQGDQIRYYLDGRYRGQISVPSVAGAVGNAVVNFEPASTSCRFTDTWIWSWESAP